MAENCCQLWGYRRCILVLWAEHSELGTFVSPLQPGSPISGFSRTAYSIPFSSAAPSSASRLRDFMNQAGVLRLANPTGRHVLLQLSCPCRQVQLLAVVCNPALQRAVIPQEWKTAKITPLYKKGSITDARNYRMLAVSGTSYRLYANVM
eukprot:1151755-Pelagomonas_calceolata.AAC.1